MKKLFFIGGFALMMGGSNASIMAANVYVRPNGTGNGSSWSQAVGWSGVTFVRGNTYYFADGSYSGSKTLDTPVGAGAVITLKKATVADHGTNDGWSMDNSDGDGRAEFNGSWNIDTSNWLIDGQRGGGPGNWDGSVAPFGFYIKAGGRGLFQHFGNAVSNITVRHMMIEGNGYDGCNGWGTDLVHLLGDFTDVTLSYLYLKDASQLPLYLQGHKNFVLEYSYIQRNENLNIDCGGSEQHSEGMHGLDHSSSTIRFNKWEDIEGTAVMALRGSKFRIYGNLIYGTSTNPQHGVTSNGSIAAAGSGAVVSNSEIYNNTIANTRGYAPISFPGGSGITVKNNLFYNNQSAGVGSGIATASNNITAGSNPFLGSAINDFRLKSGAEAIDAGSPLGGEFAKDIENKTRPQGGGWDVGAYEFGANVVSNYHPADINSDFFMALNEATTFGACWKSNCNTNATLDNAVRAGTLWAATNDGRYQYNSANACPACWEIKP